jgi:hypothetical protein
VQFCRILFRFAHQCGFPPLIRFLKRVHQTAAWIEVSEETAREKASQVLRDAVAGLLDGKGVDDGLERDNLPIHPLPAVSAPISIDERDESAPLSRRLCRKDYALPRPSESKRRRYTTESSESNSLEEPYSSMRQQVVGCSPIRRHAEESYRVDNRDGVSYRESTTSYRSSAHTNASTLHQPTQHHNLGNLDEFALLRGELLESDDEEESLVLRNVRGNRF